MSEETTDRQRLILLKESLALLYPARIVTRNLLAHEARTPAEMKQGVYTIVSAGAEGYKNYNGREAMDGNHKIALFGQFMGEEGDTGEDIEDKEFVMVEEIKAFLRAAAPVRPAALCCLVATGYLQSAQLDHPWGGIRFDLECPND